MSNNLLGWLDNKITSQNFYIEGKMGSAYDKVLWPCLLYYLYYAISNRVLQNEIDEKEERKRELAPDVPEFSYLTVVWCLWGTHDSVNCPVFVSLKHYIWVYMPTLIKQFTSKNHTKHLEYCKQIQLWPKGKKKFEICLHNFTFSSFKV